MALPRSVTVLGDKIRVLQVDAKTMKYEAQDDTAIGLALLLENKILILKKCHRSFPADFSFKLA